ncbi:hypothetical protein GCM10022225_80660 [Plantactinospora mayteni]|uniref:DUF2399 domain-containing protein n=1 Tax=Plantactinospora mayteni TaxID=566021 RepID=A0ABQ4F3I3_9ACTN|nr:hypothetical protein Pma05_80240 [Plantactinospora mayteni]
MTALDGTCPWCGANCDGIDFRTVRGPHIDWIWQQLADIGDRRGYRDLASGTATVTAPSSRAERAAALGLLGGRSPRSGQKIRVNLADLTARLTAHHPRLTPGMVAAHVIEQSLGERVRDKARRHDALAQLRQQAVEAFDRIPGPAPVHPDMAIVWPALQRTGWISRLIGMDDGRLLIDQAAAVIAALPAGGERVDRRRLADGVTRFPHALDTGPLPGLVLAILTAAGAVQAGLPPRAAWAAVGVDCDDLTGGLLALGIYPAGWSIPADAVVTLPPRELARCAWPAPSGPGGCVFVTENPSVVTAAADRVAAAAETADAVRLLCTVGTPSALEIAAIGRLADAGWLIAARADFDQAGLQHVAALLKGVPAARPWRMGAADYEASLATTPVDDRTRLRPGALPATSWDPALRHAMEYCGLAAYEESLIETLLVDLTNGSTPE